MIRVLVAEDSPTARALLVAVLSTDPEIAIVGEARNGA
jgi:two-component system chemotaxis response regulator CheB